MAETSIAGKESAELSSDSSVTGVYNNDIKNELNYIKQWFEDKVSEYRAKYFVDGKGLILVNHSTENETKIGFLINYLDLKSTSMS